MNKLTTIVTTIFCVLTIIAIAMDSIHPEGFNTTPTIHRQSVREASAHGHGGHGGFMHGK